MYTANPLPVVEPDQFYKYLGVAIGYEITYGGRCLPNRLQDALNRLQGAPLKTPTEVVGSEKGVDPKIHPPCHLFRPHTGHIITSGLQGLCGHMEVPPPP